MSGNRSEQGLKDKFNIDNVIESSMPNSIIQQSVNSSKLDQQSQCHVYTYETPWRCYAMGYSWRPDHEFRFGISSYIIDQDNQVMLILP